MPVPNDLATLQSVKQWVLGNSVDSPWVSVASDPMLGAMITAASRAAFAFLSRSSMLSRTVTEQRSGTRTQSMILREWPVTAIASLSVDGLGIPPAPSLGSGGNPATSVGGGGGFGYVLEPWDGYPPGHPQKLALRGLDFGRVALGVSVAYTAGYAVLGEVATVPAPDSGGKCTLAPAEPYGRWAADVQVTQSDGATKLTALGQGATPATGQYVPPAPPPATLSSPDSWKRFYTFAPADQGSTVLLFYSYVPADLDYAISKWVGEWWAYRTRPGQKSQALPQGMGTSSFDLSAMPDDVKMVLKAYRRVVPIGG